MQKPPYNWQRYWYPARSGYHLPLIENGYLIPPAQEYAHLVRSEGKTVLELASAACVVLLGEPGIGKTNEMECLERLLKEERHAAVLRVELGKKPTEHLLRDSVFQAPEYRAWLADNHRLHLLLDGLDEWPFDITIPFYLLVNMLPKELAERLSVYISCRTTDWPSSFEDELKRIWGEVLVYQLAPLSRENVAEAVRAGGLDPAHFLQEVSRHGLVPLAARPLTLNVLLASYRQHTAFPATLSDLYLESCRALCEESNERHLLRQKRKLDREQRMLVAARIAALSVFANRPTIWTGKEPVEAPGDVQIRDLWGNAEQVRGQGLDVNEASIREALGTGLFSQQGEDRLGWAHATYAEFLAAYYLWVNQIPVVQVMSLLTQYVDGEKRVIPQLYGTAGWLATMHPGVFRELLGLEPEVVLGGDVARLSGREREALVGAFFSISTARLGQLHFSSRHLYHRLNHSQLSVQLHPTIGDGGLATLKRTVAISMASACGLIDLQGELLALALDQQQPGPVREDAAEALASLGDDLTLAQLKPLVALPTEQDPNDEVKGHALSALWPAHLTTQELFAALTLSRNDQFSGAYHRFLRSPLIDRIPPQDLPIALAWVERLPSRQLPTPQWDLLFSIADQVMLRAWQDLDQPGVAGACARVIAARIALYDPVVCGCDEQARALLEGLAERRLQLLERVLALLIDRTNWSVQALYMKPPLFWPQDIPWLLSYLSRESTESFQREVARLIRLLLQHGAIDQLETVTAACQSHAILAEEMAHFFTAQEQMNVEERVARPPAEAVEQEGSLMERLSALLKEDGDPFAIWQRFWAEATNRGGRPASAWLFDRSAFPAWEKADAALREQVLRAGRRFLECYDPRSEEWLATNALPYLVWIAFKTLQLLMQEDPVYLAALPIEQWRRLIPVVLTMSDPTAAAVDADLIRMAQRVASGEVAAATLRIMNSDEQHLRGLPTIQKMCEFLDEALERALLNKLQEPALAAGSLEWLLRALLSHGVRQGESFAYTLISDQLPQGDDGQCERAVVAAHALLFYTKSPRWLPIWTALREHEAFGKKLVAKIAHGSSGWVPPFLTEDEQADLYLWVVEHYPPAEYPLPETTMFSGAVDSIALWRDSLVQRLRERGTQQAAAALRRIVGEQPEIADRLNLEWILLDAQKLAVRRTWQPFGPGDLLALLYHRHIRLVQSGGQLLEVVMEALADLERRFGDETPAWRDVWDRVPTVVCHACGEKIRPERPLYRPLEEDEFSDYLKRHLTAQLKERGVIANREVEISSRERTDIHIDAVRYDQRGAIYDRVTVIIEVKGCWNRAWRTAMEEQLVARYLEGNTCRDGLFLLGWFLCGGWDQEGDYRYADTPKLSIEEAHTSLHAQADALSGRGRNVKALVLDARIKRYPVPAQSEPVSPN